MGNKRKSKKVKVSLRTRTVAVVSISLPLVLLAWMFVLQIMQEGFRRQVQEDFTFTLILDKDISQPKVNALVGRLTQEPAIKNVTYISADSAAREVSEELQEDPLKVLGYNPFYPSLELNLHAQYATRDSLPKIDSLIHSLGGVDNFSYRSDMIGEMDSIIARISLGLLVAVVLMLLIAFIQMANTTHLLIYARRFLIRSMTLLGAPYSLICRPILRTTVLNGLWGGLFADFLVALSIWAGYTYVSSTIMSFLSWYYLLAIGIGLPLLGMLLSLVTALCATRRYIRMDGSRIMLG